MSSFRFLGFARHALLTAMLAAGCVALMPVAQAATTKQKVVQQKKQAQAKKSAKVAKVAKLVKKRVDKASAKKLAARKEQSRLKSRAVAAAPVLSVGEQLGLRKVDDPLNLNSSAVLVVDQSTHEILLGKNDTAVLPIASLTKLMTGFLITEAQLPMDEMISIESEDVDRLKNSGSRLAVGTKLSRGEALHLALMSSENRAAHALARTYPGGVSAFVQLMNKRAEQLGMSDTRYVDPTGLSSENRSSARDLATLATAAYEKPMVRDLSTSPSYEVAGRRGVLQYRNSNRLVHDESWNIGLQKTGYIREAGRCLVMQVSVAGRQLIMVLLDAAGPAARIGDAQRLRRWAESALFSSGELISGGQS